jgi:hypothetical protein
MYASREEEIHAVKRELEELVDKFPGFELRVILRKLVEFVVANSPYI